MHETFSAKSRKFMVFCLAFFILLGYVFGFYSVTYSGPVISSMMHAAPGCSMSIVGLLAVVLLPFLLAAVAVLLSKPYWLLPICFLEAFSHAICLYGICVAFSYAGWLVSCLLLLSKTASLAILFAFGFRYLQLRIASPIRTLVVSSAFALCIGIADYGIIAPFMVKLINF